MALGFDLKVFQSELKVMLKRIDEVLTANGITYTVAYGTLLGAIREGDIIPWDDDVDIYVKRADYDKARAAIRSQCKNYYVWDWDNENGCDLNSARIFQRLGVCTSREMELSYIDMYVLDKAPENWLLRMVSATLWVTMWRLINIKSGHKIFWSPWSLASFVFYFTAIPFVWLPVETLKKMYIYFRGRFFSSDRWVWYPHNGKKTVTLSAGFDHPVRHKFGDMTVLVPTTAIDILKMCYGNWSKPPPEGVTRGQHAYTDKGVTLATRPEDDLRR